MKILLTGGIGDIFAVESFMSNSEKSRIEGIYYASRAADILESLFRSISFAFPKLKEHTILSRSLKTYYNKLQVERDFGPVDAEDFSINRIFNQQRCYNSSSFLKRPLAEIERLKEKYVVICPMSSTWGSANRRNFNDNDWSDCLNVLEKIDLYGLVLYSGEGNIPKHRKIINFQNKTNIFESIEYLKYSEGYIGIDSCFSVLAAKLHLLLCVKSVSGYCWVNRYWYFSPRETFGFLRSRIIPTFKPFLGATIPSFKLF